MEVRLNPTVNNTFVNRMPVQKFPSDRPSQTPAVSIEMSSALTPEDAEKLAQACGVQIAKNQFIAKAMTLCAAVSGTSVLGYMTTRPEGDEITPALGVSLAGVGMAVCDTVCALYNWRSKVGGGKGLEMGGDGIGNGVFQLMRKCGIAPEKSERCASVVSKVVQAGYVTASGAVCAGEPFAAESTGQGILIGTATMAAPAVGVLAEITTLNNSSIEKQGAKYLQQAAERRSNEIWQKKTDTLNAQIDELKRALAQEQNIDPGISL